MMVLYERLICASSLEKRSWGFLNKRKRFLILKIFSIPEKRLGEVLRILGGELDKFFILFYKILKLQNVEFRVYFLGSISAETEGFEPSRPLRGLHL